MSGTAITTTENSAGIWHFLKMLSGVCKLRIGVTIAYAALAGLAITPGSVVSPWQAGLLILAVLLSSASAGGFNQYLERDLDPKMGRTRHRPFATGKLNPSLAWPAGLTAMLVIAVAVAAWVANAPAALYVFLGAFFYVVVYTVWLKRRSPLNIVIGGLAGSFAVLAGAAAVDPSLSARPLLLALILFLWTPPHFWSLAIALKEDYRAAGVPMLPVVIGERRCAGWVLAHIVAILGVSLWLMAEGMGWVYLAGALSGGLWFLYKGVRLLRNPDRANAMSSFHASLLQLTLLLTAIIAERAL